VFENRVLKRIFRLKREEVTGDWRKLRNEELQIGYDPGDKINKNKMGGACGSTRGEDWYIQGFGGES
jgi:hypothetical protein